MAPLRRRAAAPSSAAPPEPTPPATTPGDPRSELQSLAAVVGLALLSFANALEGGWSVDDPRAFAGNRDVVGQLDAPATGAGALPGAAGPAEAGPALGDDGSADPFLPSSGLGVGEELPSGATLRALPLATLWADDYWGEPMGSANSHKSYRPLTVLSFRLSHWLWGAVLPGGGVGVGAQRAYHAENVVLHALVCALFLAAIRKAAPRQRRLALYAALLFACHAVHVAAVANITGRAELLAAAMFLASFLAYPHGSGGGAEVQPLRLLASTALGVLAMLCKEPGVTVFGVNVLVDAAGVLRQNPGWRWAAARRVALRAAVVALLGGAALHQRWLLNNGQAPRFSSGMNPIAMNPSEPVARWRTHAFVWVRSYWLLLFPLDLSVDWGHSSIPLITTWVDMRNLATASGFLAVGLAIRWSCARCSPALTTGWVAMLFLPFLPASNVFFPVGFVIADRAMYLPSLGFCLLAALLCFGAEGEGASHEAARQRRRMRTAEKPSTGTHWPTRLFFCVLACHLARTWLRNADWRDCRSLWSSSSRANPANEFLQ